MSFCATALDPMEPGYQQTAADCSAAAARTEGKTRLVWHRLLSDPT